MPTKPSYPTFVNPGHALASALIGAYLFNEGTGVTCHDTSGSVPIKDATFNAPSITWGISKIDNVSPAILSAATGGFSKVSLPEQFQLGGQTFSAVAWIYNTGSDNYGTILAYSNSVGWWTHGTGATFKSDMYVTSDHENTTPLNINTLYQLAITYNGTTLTFYVNGVANGTATFAIPDYTPIHVANDFLTETFVGTYDVLFIWRGRVLNATEILNLYNNPFAMYITGGIPRPLFDAGVLL